MDPNKITAMPPLLYGPPTPPIGNIILNIILFLILPVTVVISLIIGIIIYFKRKNKGSAPTNPKNRTA